MSTMKMESVVFSRLVLVLLSFCTVVRADTPANCTYEEIRGSWLFSIGEGGNDNTIKCSKGFKVVTELQVDLLFPDTAVDVNGNVGFWTMIYNQGFEVQLNGKKYFAFSAFKKSGKKVVSYCDRTRNGWSHDAGKYKPGNWACYKGKKMSKVPQKEETLNLFAELENRKFTTNHEFINHINNVQNLWKAVVYEDYSGMTVAQLMSRAGGPRRVDFPHTSQVSEADVKAAEALPETFDWRNVDGKDYVSPIRDQLDCGSCYAFGTMALFEARVRILTNGTKTPVFSTQDIVSCSEYSQGCEGGFPYLISKYAEDFGLVEEQCFPYEGKELPCPKEKCPRQFGTGYHYIGGFYGACNEVLMRLELVKNGPVAVSFQVYDDFKNYKSGIYHHTGLKDKFNPFEITNHVVLVVGYGADKTNGEKFWIVKNSWGESWGEDGYFRIRRGTDECSIESIAVAAEPVLN